MTIINMAEVVSCMLANQIYPKCEILTLTSNVCINVCVGGKRNANVMKMSVREPTVK